MSRSLEAGLTTLINSGHCEDHTVLTITLGDGTVLRFATASLVISGNTYLANLGESDALKMSLTQALDRMNLKAQNVDKALGQTILGIPTALEGASAMLGVAVKAQDGSGPLYYDDKMPGDLLAGEIDEQWVNLTFVGDLYAGQVIGELVSQIFPYQQDSQPTQTLRDPNDIGPIGPRPGGIDFDPWGPRRGRLPMPDLN